MQQKKPRPCSRKLSRGWKRYPIFGDTAAVLEALSMCVSSACRICLLFATAPRESTPAESVGPGRGGGDGGGSAGGAEAMDSAGAFGSHDCVLGARADTFFFLDDLGVASPLHCATRLSESCALLVGVRILCAPRWPAFVCGIVWTRGKAEKPIRYVLHCSFTGDVCDAVHSGRPEMGASRVDEGSHRKSSAVM